MNEHLSRWEQEEYVLGQRTPAMGEHMRECPACRAEVARMESGISSFRDTAVQWSALSMAKREAARLPLSPSTKMSRAWGWPAAQLAAAAMLLLVLFAIHPWSGQVLTQKAVVQPPAAITDDALLEQVDDQLSVAVPASMESLTHLVTTNSSQNNEPAGLRSQQHVQTN